MSSQLAIIILVDVEAALSENTLTGNCYLVDNNKFRGSENEGTDKLITMVEGNQIMNWLILPIDLFSSNPIPYVEDVGGDAVEKDILIPQIFDSPELTSHAYWWGGNAAANVEGIYDYTLTINIGGTKFDLNASMHIKRAFSNYDSIQSQGVWKSPKAEDFQSINSRVRFVR